MQRSALGEVPATIRIPARHTTGSQTFRRYRQITIVFSIAALMAMATIVALHDFIDSEATPTPFSKDNTRVVVAGNPPGVVSARRNMLGGAKLSVSLHIVRDGIKLSPRTTEETFQPYDGIKFVEQWLLWALGEMHFSGFVKSGFGGSDERIRASSAAFTEILMGMHDCDKSTDPQKLRFPGHFFHVLGDGWFDEVRTTALTPHLDAVSDATERYRWELAKRLSQFPAGTVVYYNSGDTDAFYDYVQLGPNASSIRCLQKLIDRFPQLHFLSPNPTIVNPLRGYIGRRVIPVPDYHHLNCLFNGAETWADSVLWLRNEVPRETRLPGVAWRGVTTGFFRNYNDSDRAKAVRAFFTHPRTSSVKFNKLVQNVTLHEDYLNDTVKPNFLMQYRVLLDIDGNANAWESLRWKLQSYSAVVKVFGARFVQWYYPSLENNRNILLLHPDDPHLARRALELAGNESRVAAMADAALTLTDVVISCKAAERYLDTIPSKFSDLSTTRRDWRPKGADALLAAFGTVPPAMPE